MRIKIFIIIILLSLNTIVLADGILSNSPISYNDTTNTYSWIINTSQIPGDLSLNISVALNTSLYNTSQLYNISTNNTGRLTLIPSSTVSAPGSFIANIHLENLSASNYSDFAGLINSNNSNDTISIAFHYEILNDTPINTTLNNSVNITINSTPYVQTGFNDYTYLICTYSLPQNQTLSHVSISGGQNQIIYADYDQNFFHVPAPFTISDQNYSIIDINITLAANLAPQQYDKRIRFSVFGNYSDINFHFIVKDCIAPFPQQTEMIRVCSIVNKTASDFIECQGLQADYQQAVYRALLSEQNNYTQNVTNVVYENVTQRIPVLDLNDPVLSSALSKFPALEATIETITREFPTLMSAKDSKIGDLQTQLGQCSANRVTDLQSAIAPLQNQLNNQSAALEDYRHYYTPKSTIWWLLFWIVFFTGLVFGLRWWYEEYYSF